MNGPQHRHPRTASAIARRILWVILAVADGFAPTPSAFGLPPAERWLPTNTLAYVTVPNAAVARVAWQGQSPARLWADPAMRPFRRHVEDRWSALLADPLEKLTGFRFDELLGLAQGQCTLAWIEAAASGAAPAADRHVLLVDAGSDPTSLDTWWTCRDPALRVERFAASGASVVAVPLAPGTFDDLFRGFLPPLDSASARTTNASAPNALYVARHGNAILVTTSTNVLTHALPRLSEPTVPSPPSEVLRGTVSVPALLRHLPALPQVLGGFASSEAGAGLRGWASALGLGSLRQVAFAIRASPEGWASEVRLVVPSAARQGLFGMFALREADASPPPFVPVDAHDFVRVRFSGSAAWSGLERTLQELDPAILGVLRLFAGYAGKTEDADFDFEKGVIDLLGDDWIATTLPAGPSNAPAPLLLVGSPKAPQLYHGLRLVASPAYLATFFPPDVPAPTRTESVVRGQTVATVALPPMPWYDGATGIVHFAQHRGYVAISTALPALAGFLDTNAVPSLAAHPNFVELTRRAGGAGGGYFAYVDERRAAATRWKSLAESPQTFFEDRAWIALSPTALRLAAGVENWTNPKLLPQFERVSDYFGPRVTTGRSTSNALEFVTFRPSRSSPRP